VIKKGRIKKKGGKNEKQGKIDPTTPPTNELNKLRPMKMKEKRAHK